MEKFMSEHVRDPLPDRLVWETEDTKSFGRVDWLVVDALGEGEPAGGLFPHTKPSGRVTVDRRDNLFEIATIGVTRFTLLLSADEVDFASPVKVVTNGIDSFEGAVEPEVATLLKWAAKDNDRTMLFSAELTIDVP